jgi:hypothetical protein
MAVHVYLIANDLLGIIKIGYSRAPLERLNVLRNVSGCDLRLIKSAEPNRSASLVEKELHDLFSSDRGLGEWFKITENEAIQAFNLACKKRNPNNRIVPGWLSKNKYKPKKLI